MRRRLALGRPEKACLAVLFLYILCIGISGYSSATLSGFLQSGISMTPAARGQPATLRAPLLLAFAPDGTGRHRPDRPEQHVHGAVRRLRAATPSTRSSGTQRRSCTATRPGSQTGDAGGARAW